MKILYVKNNSERAKAFQLKTIIYEEDGQKYIKKEALTKEAIPHLKKMKESYRALFDAIRDPKVKVAPIVGESDNSLTFAFIEGESLERRFDRASSQERKTLLEAYMRFVKETFQTLPYEESFAQNPLYPTLFGKQEFSTLAGEVCFKGISNIDLIFSNIIYNKDEIYLIDYEWAYEINLPVGYVIQRTLSMLQHTYAIETEVLQHTLLYQKMERHFVDTYVMREGFYFQKHNYVKHNVPIEDYLQVKENHIKAQETHIGELTQHVEKKEEHITELGQRIQKMDTTIKEKDNTIQNLGKELTYARSVVALRDRQIQSMRIKNRIKNLIKKALFLKNDPEEIALPEEPTETTNSLAYTYTPPPYTPQIKESIASFAQKPRISIVMPVYNVDPKWLNLAIESVKHQWYDNWELCIADDKSTNEATVNYLKSINHPQIKVTFLETNSNISAASNAAIALCSGEYIALLDNDDELTPNALYEMVKVINEQEADFIYSDEDFISTEGVCSNPHYKPDFSPDLLLSHNYITHFSCFKKSLLEQVGAFNSKFDGSQDYDLFLRLTEKTDTIYHIPKVLYHWRMLESSTSANSQAKPEAIERGRVVLEETLKRRGIEAEVLHGNLHHYFRVKYAIKNNPLVSIIIPFKDKPELLEMSVTSVIEKSTYQNFEIIGISNNSQEQATFDMMLALEQKDARVKFYEYNTEFNYADINNHAVNTYAKGEHILLLNNDIEVISKDWIESMLEHSQRKEIGCVGAKLYFPNDTIQHAGVIIGLGGYAGHSHKMYPRDNPGYFNRLNAVQNLSAVTAACLMIKKSIYQEIGGMNAVEFKVAYNDVDFCLRVREKGYLNLFTPYAQMYHHESISRGYEDTQEKIARFQTEKDALFQRHKEILTHGDPYYNPNLCHDKEDFSLCPK